MRILSRLLALVLTCWIAVPSFAADIRILPQNPYDDGRLRLLNLNPAYIGADGMIQRYGPPPNLDVLTEKWRWAFDGGLSGDGAHTYETLHMPAAFGSLRAGRVVHVSGQIAKGDADRLAALVRDAGLSNCLSAGYCPFTNVISLDSPGGNFAEALRMAELVRAENFVTVLGENTRCESACALVFLAGLTTYEGFFFPRRFAHITAQLGVHQPALTLPERTYSASEVNTILALLSTSTNRVTQLFLQSGVSIGLLDAMYATPANAMHRLGPIEMAGEHIHLIAKAKDTQSDLVGALSATRGAALAYCGQQFRAMHKTSSMDIIHNLQVDVNSFITFEAGRNFACMGIRQPDNTWNTHVCGPTYCGLSGYGQVSFMQKPTTLKYYDQMDSIAVGIDNTELGIAIKDFAHRGALLAYVREFAKDDYWHFAPVPLTAAQITTPAEYCGVLDDANPELVRQVQAKLNALGINVGRPDGSPGGNTRKGIMRAHEQLLGQSNSEGRITPNLLVVLGISRDAQERFRFCASTYTH